MPEQPRQPLMAGPFFHALLGKSARITACPAKCNLCAPSARFIPPWIRPHRRTAHATGFFPLTKPWRIARNVVIGVVATLFIIWLVLYITKGRFLKHPFESVAGKMAGREVKVRGDFQLYFAPLQIKFYAEGLSVANPTWATRPNLFQAQKIDTRISPLSLIFGKKRFYWLDLTGGALDLEWNAAHTTNTWTFADTGGKPFELPRIDRATVAGTTVRYHRPADAAARRSRHRYRHRARQENRQGGRACAAPGRSATRRSA